MMKYRLYINSNRVNTTGGLQGIILGNGTVAALHQHSGLKDYPSNTSNTIHGKRVLPGFTPKVAARDVQVTLGLQASSFAEFTTRYNALIETLEAGTVDLRIDSSENFGQTWTTGETYHLLYLSCAQYSEFNGRLAKFVIKFNEPNPKNREA
jgi:hypothetical protein